MALIFPSPEHEPTEITPDDFPYWENVGQRRYEGPSVIYLGAGWVMTARHVGIGEVVLAGKIFKPNFKSAHSLMNVDGSGADVMIFRLGLDAEQPDLPLLPIASEAPRSGEVVIVIGFGRGREKVIEWDEEGADRFGFAWSNSGSKRWGTNRVHSNRELGAWKRTQTHLLTFTFDQPHSKDSTPFEAHAALGDSGGGVFVKRDGSWELVGMMTAVTSRHGTPSMTSSYEDIMHAANMSYYRSEIQRWARPACINGIDDDGDLKIDFPLDPDCRSAIDSDERSESLSIRAISESLGAVGLLAMACVGVVSFSFFWVRARR